jgi:hypothetical protein
MQVPCKHVHAALWHGMFPYMVTLGTSCALHRMVLHQIFRFVPLLVSGKSDKIYANSYIPTVLVILNPLFKIQLIL